jgi:hypothetical protein
MGCPSGTYLNGDACIQCAEGKYSNATGQTSDSTCKSCLDGVAAISTAFSSNGSSAIDGNYAPAGSTSAAACINSKSPSTCSNVPKGAQMKFANYMTCSDAAFPCDACRVDGVYVMWMYGYDATATLAVFKAAFTPALTDEPITVKTANVAFVTGLPQAIKVTFTVQHTKTWTALSLTGISGVVDVAAPATKTLAAAISAADKASAPKVEITLGFAAALTTAEQLNVRTGIATAAGTPVDNVELKLKTRRAVEYVATVYAKDAAAADAVKTKLADSTAVKAALAAAGAPAPTTVSAPAVVTATTSTDTLNASPRALPGLGTQLMAAFVTVLATVMLVQQS